MSPSYFDDIAITITNQCSFVYLVVYQPNVTNSLHFILQHLQDLVLKGLICANDVHHTLIELGD